MPSLRMPANGVTTPSGKPSAEPLRCLPLRATPFHQELLSEYERSFRPFETYRFVNGTWVPRRSVKTENEWLHELQDTRRRALENKAKLRGDHFSREHLLQIPSRANAFWEPAEILRVLPDDGVIPSLAYRKHGGDDPRNAVHPSTVVVADSNDRRPNSASVAVQTNSPLLTAKSISQSTQTLSDKDLNPVMLTVAPTLNDDQNDADEEVPKAGPLLDSSRLDILRKAKYVDAKDNILFSATLPRSFSLRSGLNRSLDGEGMRRSTSSVTGLNNRPRSSLSDKSVNSVNKHSNTYRLAGAGSNVAEEARSTNVPAITTTERRPRPQSTKSRRPEAAKDEMRLQESGSGSNLQQVKRAGHVLPVSAFTISPPKRETIRYGEGRASNTGKKNETTRAPLAWDIAPPSSQDNRPWKLGAARSKSAGLRRTNNLRRKEGGLAWVDL
ncbi:uncharacterized protein LOC129588211 isoform X2 [Paramacrobiotus metropolitanus]|uniref:uncharacterized protein LOC129588211 isoform X2 n=1 Tax=Paramacrobiotus metropolitanus TaxID=2943436 RepID=UPI002445A312|nr:uncharacterized protein LOC129588211 isoform X2 [Paramacrobiotus metropolitanus]